MSALDEGPEPELPYVHATAYLTPLREGGSLPGLVEADDLGSLLAGLRERHGAELARVLALSSVLHDGQYVSDPDLPLGHDAVLDVLHTDLPEHRTERMLELVALVSREDD